MFDRAEIKVKAGDGGDGIISFRREKFVPFGGPDGGNGGRGGDVIIEADLSVTSLKIFLRKKVYEAEDGKRGGSKKKHGFKGANLILPVPVGTVVSEKTQIGDNVFLADLEQSGQPVVVARGGRGGFGNAHYTTATNQAPRIAQKGERGEEKSLILELRLIADVGIIGYPNVGKSTLLAAVSAARPKIADYPFTTVEPILGVVEVGEKSFILAEIPGLIEGAHLGRGLGHDFLRHALRTKMFIHLIDGSSPSPVDNMLRVNNELVLFDSSLAQKPQIVCVNKIDLPQVRARTKEIREAFAEARIEVCFISAETKEGVPELMAETMRKLNQLTLGKAEMKQPALKVFYPQPRSGGIRVHKEGEVFVLEVPGLERLVSRRGDLGAEVAQELKGRLNRLGVNKALLKAGIKPGDKVRCGTVEWEWAE